MPETMNWSLAVQIPGGPKMTRTGVVSVTAYDKISAIVPAGGDATEVDVQPGDLTELKLLLVSVDPNGPVVTYCVNAAQPDPAKRIKLDGPLVLIGGGAVRLTATPDLGDPTKIVAPQTIFFYNADTTTDAVVQILVGREAVEQP
jgi:hypothetical protein